MTAKNTEKDRERYVKEARRVTWLGLVGNLGLCVLKLVGGVLGNSQAVVADGVHSLTDSSTDITILLGVGFWSKPPDSTHPHGHRRIETLITTAIGILLMAVATGLAYRAIATLQTPRGHAPGWIALVAAVVSILSKEGLFRWTASVGRRISSSAILANAWHHRSDAFSSVPVAVAVLAARVMPEWGFVDHLAGAVVSVFIFRAGLQIAWPAVKELVDVGASDEELERIRKVACQTPGVRDIHGIRTRYVGGSIKVDLHVLVDGDMSVYRGHEIAESVKDRLIESGPDVVDAEVHIEPTEAATRPHCPPEVPDQELM